MSARISEVEKGSLADLAGIKQGELIERINGIEITDYLDYMYSSSNEDIEITLPDRKVNIINEDYEPLGIYFESMLIDKPRSCQNKCIFCFIDQLPNGMRETCYFKDDDYRLSFLQGNYVSMTNMNDDDVERIIRYNIPRINISVHTTNPTLREKMLHNKRAGEVLKYLERFAEGGLMMNGQIVLCPGINDGAEFDRTLHDLFALGDSMESVSVVPVGLTDHRSGLFDLALFDKEGAKKVIRQVEEWQRIFIKERGTAFVFLADEFYLMAEEDIPSYDHYEDFLQIENGVGLSASLEYEFYQALEDKKEHIAKHKKTVATGVLAHGLISKLANEVGDNVYVEKIENKHFGKNITVAGLIVGKDLISQLKGKEVGKELLISSSMLRHNENVFLDDVTIEEVEQALGVKVTPVENDGYALLDAFVR